MTQDLDQEPETVALCATLLRSSLNQTVFNLPVAWVVISGLVEGQIGLKSMVDDGNLTYFIIRGIELGIDFVDVVKYNRCNRASIILFLQIEEGKY
jgi:hypothetical protein